MVDVPILLIIAVIFLIIGGIIMGVVMLRAAVLSRLNVPVEDQEIPSQSFNDTAPTQRPTVTPVLTTPIAPTTVQSTVPAQPVQGTTLPSSSPQPKATV